MVSLEVGRDNRRACVALRIGLGHNAVPDLRTKIHFFSQRDCTEPF
jgi:hypothetical protein